MKVLLDLCAGSGSWSEPYREAGWIVERVDLVEGRDVRTARWVDLPVRGILAAPPCTVFAVSGARWERSEEEMLHALSLVDACLRAVAIYEPAFWCLENPIGTLHRWLGPPKHYFHPCEYGDPWTKRTALWGRFTMPPKVDRVVADVRQSPWYVPPGPERSALRSVTPPGFARAFFEANQ